MKISVILAHPYEKSFNHAITAKILQTIAANGHDFFFHDLYAEKFNPLITAEELVSDRSGEKLVEIHKKQIREADGIIIIHPNWWGQPPAILKGWTDRVLRENTAYAFTEGDDGSGVPKGLLTAKAALVFNTSNTEEYRENKIFGDPLERIWKDCVFDFCGIKTFFRKTFRIIASSSAEDRKTWLNEAAAAVTEYFPPYKK